MYFIKRFAVKPLQFQHSLKTDNNLSRLVEY